MSTFVPSSEDLTLLEALAEGATYRDAAARAGCSAKTVQRRMRDDAFVGALDDLNRERWRSASRRLKAIAVAAVGVLEELLGEASERTGANVRLRAAMAALELGHEIGETAEIEARLNRLEEAVGIANGWRKAA